MSTKHTSTVLAKCADDETIFVIRAQDVTARETIQHWLRLNAETLPLERYDEVLRIIEAMEQWPSRKMPD